MQVSDLPSLDPELYKNLMFLKSYEGDVSDLCLDFTASEEAYGMHKVTDRHLVFLYAFVCW